MSTPAATGGRRPDRRLLLVGAIALVAVVVLVLVLALRGGGDDPGGGPATGSATQTTPVTPEGPTGSGTGTGTPSSVPASTGSPTIPGVVEDPATVPASRVLLCDVTGPRVRALLGPDGATPDTLRIGSDALVQLLPDWRDGAIGYPLADDRIVLAGEVSGAWERAVAAYDAGDQDAARGFVADADEALAELDGLEPLPGC